MEKYPNRCTFFVSPKIAGDEPMVDTAFWSWLNESKESRFVEALKGYLKPQGFDITKHVLEEEQVDRHTAVYEHFWWCQYHPHK